MERDAESDLAKGCGQSRKTVGAGPGWEGVRSTNSSYIMEVQLFHGLKWALQEVPGHTVLGVIIMLLLFLRGDTKSWVFKKGLP